MHKFMQTCGRLALVPTLACTAGLATAGDQSKNATQMTLKGQVDAFSTVTLRNEDDEKVRGLVRIKLENGRKAIVDLGDEKDLKNVDIEKGDFVEIRGEKTTIDGRKVLEANRLRVRGAQAGTASNERERYSGEYGDSRQVRSRQGEATILLLELDNGDQRTVYIPAIFAVKDSDLQKADKIELIGSERRNRGRSAVVAERVRVDGQEIQPQMSRDGLLDTHGTQMPDGQSTRARSSSRDLTNRSSGGRDHQDALDTHGTQMPDERPTRGRSSSRDVDFQNRRAQNRRDSLDTHGTQMPDEQPTRARSSSRDTKRYNGFSHSRDERYNGFSQSRNERQQRNARSEAQRSQRGQVVMSGTVEEFARVRFDNAPDDNLFARVRLEDGSKRVVDFGDISSAQQLDLESGDVITIKGMKRQLNGRQVLEARSVRIKQDAQASKQSQRQGKRSYMRSGVDAGNDASMIQGTVKGMKKVKVRGQDGKVAVMKIQLKDGTSQALNIAPALANQILEIEKGDQIVAAGQQHKTRGGTNVMIVDNILVIDDMQNQGG